MAYTIEVAGIEAIEAEWRDLLPRCAVQTVFLSPAWLKVWWQEFKAERRLQIFAVRHEGRLVGIAPLMWENGRVLLAGDSFICDYMDITAEGGQEEAVVRSVMEELAKLEWNEGVFWGLPSCSPTLTHLPAAAAGLGLEVFREVEDVCPRVGPLSSWEDYLSGLSKKDRHELRRKMRRLASAETALELRDFRSPSEVALAMDDFLRLHALSRPEKAEFMTGKMAAFFRRIAVELAGEGFVRLFQLDIGNTVAASILCFDYGDKFLLYNSGYDPDLSSLSVGILSKALSLRRAIEEGKRHYDFLRGAEPYKYDLGGKDMPVYRCIVRRT